LGCEVQWKAIGKNGHKIEDLVTGLELLPQLTPDLIVVSVGVNDVSGMTSVTRWHLGLVQLISGLKARFRCPIIFLGIPPMGEFSELPQPLRFALGVRASMLDRLLADSAEVRNVFWADAARVFDESHVAEDGYHPNEKACEIGATQMINVLEEAGYTGALKSSGLEP